MPKKKIKYEGRTYYYKTENVTFEITPIGESTTFVVLASFGGNFIEVRRFATEVEAEEFVYRKD